MTYKSVVYGDRICPTPLLVRFPCECAGTLVVQRNELAVDLEDHFHVYVPHLVGNPIANGSNANMGLFTDYVETEEYTVALVFQHNSQVGTRVLFGTVQPGSTQPDSGTSAYLSQGGTVNVVARPNSPYGAVTSLAADDSWRYVASSVTQNRIITVAGSRAPNVRDLGQPRGVSSYHIALSNSYYSSSD